MATGRCLKNSESKGDGTIPPPFIGREAKAMRAKNRSNKTLLKLFLISSVAALPLASGALPSAAVASRPPNARPTTSSAAALTTIEFEAKVTRVDEEGNVLGGAVRVGETIRGSYRYDSSTPDTNDPPEFGLYEHTSGNAGITVNTKNLVFQTDPNNVSFQMG